METNPENVEQQKKSTGLKALLDKSLESYEKLPMLEIVFEKLVRLLTTALRNLTSENVDITIKEISSERFSVYYKKITPPCSIIVFKVIEWDNLGLIILDNPIVYSLLDLLFGGKKKDIFNKPDNKGYTYIEQALIKQIGEVVLSELSAAFDSISPATCVFERLETNPTFAAISRPGDGVMLLKLNLDVGGKGGMLDFVIPYSTLEPIKPLLQQVFMGEKFGSDATWEDALIEKVYTIEFPIEAVIIDRNIKISSLANLKVGDTITTSCKEKEDIILRSGGIPIFMGQIGKFEEKVAINITKKCDTAQKI
ncbi:MAG: flagellar motor switch protein FliM [Rickettsiaceae bacterium]|nr:flagellar motor switch protein FliM [Rickettsiaceae bacterium]